MVTLAEKFCDDKIKKDDLKATKDQMLRDHMGGKPSLRKRPASSSQSEAKTPKKKVKQELAMESSTSEDPKEPPTKPNKASAKCKGDAKPITKTPAKPKPKPKPDTNTKPAEMQTTPNAEKFPDDESDNDFEIEAPTPGTSLAEMMYSSLDVLREPLQPF
eukprot:823503-Alexandrium_andersonii.AAC.1